MALSMHAEPPRLYAIPRERHFREMADWELGACREHRERELTEAMPGSFAWDWLVAELGQIDAESTRRERMAYKRATAPWDAIALLHAVKDKADILAVFGSRLPTHRVRVGPNYRAWWPCPMHEDRHPSLCTYGDSNSWWCFQCIRGGDAIDAVELLDGLEFIPALLKLAAEFGVDVPKATAARKESDW